MSARQWLAGIAGAVVIAGTLVFGAPAQASEPDADTAGAAASASDDVAPLISRRDCNNNERPSQIRLALTSGAVYCYGGVVGSLGLGSLNVRSLSAGGYTGFLVCEDYDGSGKVVFFDPGDFHTVNDTCQRLDITTPN